MKTELSQNRRILVIDDNRAIHNDFRKILMPAELASEDHDSAEAALFGDDTDENTSFQHPVFDVDSAYQGQEGLALIEKSLSENRPYSMAFVDVRMPPGWDGVETTAKIWQKYPDLQVVICTAYSDYSWEDILKRFGYSDRLVILKKPFDTIEVLQLAISMTEKWRLYQQTKHYLEDLEKLVQERTSKLEAANAQLNEANLSLISATEKAQLLAQEALVASNSKSEFLANMSHEIRTPMNGVIGMVNFLLETNLTQEQREFAATIKVSADALLFILNDILDFSKIEAGKMTLENVGFSLKEIVENTIKLLTLQARTKGVDLSYTIEPNACTHLMGDPNRLRQIMVNLLGNAIKFTSQGKVWLSISSVNESNEGIGLHFSIHDTGIGIPEEVLKRLFQSFTQADASTTRKFGGTGLGLAISRKLVTAMGGELSVTSIPGQGSTFSFTLQLPKQSSSDLANSESRSEASDPLPAIADAARRKIHVLVAEDGKVNRMVVTRMLDQLGFTADTVSNGAEAVEAWLKNRYQIILMDCQMPEMDGYTATRKIRELEAADRLTPAQIIALTASTMHGDRDICLAAGMTDFTSKPINKKALEDALNRAVTAISGTPAFDFYTRSIAATSPSGNGFQHIAPIGDPEMPPPLQLRTA